MHVRQFVRFVDRLSDACAVAASAMLVAAMLIVCWMVVYRALGNSTYWEIELATYLIVGAVLVGSPFCLKTHGHIGVDLVSEWLPPRGRRVLARVLAVLGLAVCLYLAWEGLAAHARGLAQERAQRLDVEPAPLAVLRPDARRPRPHRAPVRGRDVPHGRRAARPRRPPFPDRGPEA